MHMNACTSHDGFDLSVAFAETLKQNATQMTIRSLNQPPPFRKQKKRATPTLGASLSD
jgi:hypothetical protein